MKLLWLNAGILLPLDKGGKLRTWHVMRHLAAHHDITYLSFADPASAQQHRTGMYEVCTRLETVPRSDPAKGTLRFYTDAARYLLDQVPYAVAKYRSAAYRARLDGLLRTRLFDAVVCDFLVPAVNLPERLPCPTMLFTHNVESEIWRRHAETATSRAAQHLLAQQWRRMLQFEGRALARFDSVLAVSDADRQTFARLFPGATRQPITVIPTGVDTEFFKPIKGGDPNPAGEPRRLVFTGSMDWLPNEDGVAWFVRDVLPLIRQSLPDVTFSIIGRAPTAAVRRLGEQAGIEVTGRVDDVRPHMAAGTVYVVPLRIGGGTRLKIFEAMAMGKAVVSTTVGAEGLPVTDGINIAIADDAADFAATVVEHVVNRDRRRRLENAARQLVVDRYDWSASARVFEHALAHICRHGRHTVRIAETAASGLARPPQDERTSLAGALDQ